LLVIEINEYPVQPVLSIRTRTSMKRLSDTIGVAYGRIMEYLTELGVQPSDAPFTAYHNMDMENLDVEMGFPVKQELPGQEDIQFRSIPAGKYASWIYTGPYSQMEQPYNEMFRWIEEHGYEPTGVYYEYYYNSPEETAESELLTRIVIPVK